METVNLVMRFTHELTPENNENYKKVVAIEYLKSKGIKAWIEDGNIIFE